MNIPDEMLAVTTAGSSSDETGVSRRGFSGPSTASTSSSSTSSPHARCGVPMDDFRFVYLTIVDGCFGGAVDDDSAGNRHLKWLV
uniref:Uncharacterized protein n=1 Tax=Caenorhabditis japonica TaxID=281687 RepID=A0A8R1IHT0_CAEJA